MSEQGGEWDEEKQIEWWKTSAPKGNQDRSDKVSYLFPLAKHLLRPLHSCIPSLQGR